ncbi:VOC family protein [Nocardia sp. BMG111209]|uniref:VOC family protein n=1 Tax=Nocardia sp. BMG111209 TaxID=1160137 RepID=UPI000362D6D5|nr:VOC family protein [Nocardia sp. BMG111209]
MSTRLACVVFEVTRPRIAARFWADLLGWLVTADRAGAVDVAAPDPDGPDVALSFLPAPAPKSGRNRLHLDIASRSLDHQRLQVDRALALGARRIDIGQRDVPWEVLADPEGNEFCVLEPREQYVDTGAIAAIVVGSPDPGRLARFWSQAAGWPVALDEARYTGIRSATGMGPWLEFLHSADTAAAPGRLHLDLMHFAHDDPAAEVARLRAAGAVPRPETGPPLVLADPDTNEFCLLRP